jgi:hypothetical protein
MAGKQYQEMYQRSIHDPAGFWSEIAEKFYWKKKWNPDQVCTENLDVTKGPIKIEVSSCLSDASSISIGLLVCDERTESYWSLLLSV